MKLQKQDSGSRPAGVPLRAKLTRSTVDALPAPAAGSFYVYDAEIHRLAVRVMASGRKFYTVRHRFAGRQRWSVIGEHGQPAARALSGDAQTWTPESAREAARGLVGDVAKGLDPTEAKRALRGAPTLKDAAREYIEAMRSKKRPATLDQDLLLLGLSDLREKRRTFTDPRAKAAKVKRILDEKFASLKLAEITKADIGGMLHRWRDTPIRSNRALALLSHVFKWAGFSPEKNPARGHDKNKENKRKRYLNGEELARLGAVLARSDEDARAVAAIRLLVLTGARCSEILGLEWTRREGASGFVEGTKAVLLQSKTGPKDIMLAPPALEILKGLKRIAGSPFVLASATTGRPFTLSGLEHAWGMIRKAADIADVRLHDLRHSNAAVLAAGGASLPIIGAILGHTSPATTARYAHLAADPLYKAASRAAATIDKALAGKPPKSNVSRMRPR